MKTTLVLAIFTLFCITISCEKDPVFTTQPTITLVRITPEIAQEYVDSIVFTIGYTDGDGDLGENTAQAQNLFLTDNRIGVTYPYRISQLGPDGAQIPIQGNINIVLPNTGITDNSTQQTVTFDIFVKDRAGNQSNTITTTPITIIQ